MTTQQPIRTLLQTPSLALGGNTFGWTSDRDESFAVLDAFTETDNAIIDSADVYSTWGEGLSGGESETVIGEWFASRGGKPDGVVLATKASMLEPLNRQDEATVNRALDASLRRLGVDHVDLFYAHLDDGETPIEEQAATYDALVRSGKVGAIGLSVYSPERMRAWFEHARAEGLTVPSAVQVQYNLLARADFERDYQPLAREFDAATLSFFSLASGFLTGKYSSAADLEGAARQGFASGYATDEGFAVVRELTAVAQEAGVAPATAALAWLIAKGVNAPIASARTPQQLPALLAATTTRLPGDAVARLDRVSAPFA